MEAPLSRYGLTEKVDLTAVSYHNTKPFLYGLQNGPIAAAVNVHLDIPARGAQRLIDEELRLGLIPVAVLNELKDARIVSNFCIGAQGAVKTVCLYGDVPVESMSEILLDYHSRTSAQLLRLLLEHHWKLSPSLADTSNGYRSKIGGTTGGLIIGDRTMGMARKFRYCYDLSSEWQLLTGMPFVFAAWVATRDLSTTFLDDFNASLKVGVDNIDQVLKIHQANVPAGFDLDRYLNQHISYELDARKMEALKLFLEMIGHREPAFQPA